MGKDFHTKPFDSGSKLKLDLFKNYLSEWIPVFVRGKNFYKKINVFDFFAGPGKDSNGNDGSPIIIINEILKYSEDIIENNLTVNIILNEKIKNKYNKLLREIEKFKDSPINIIVENCDFPDCYSKYKTLLSDKDSANLLLFDQTGIKHISKELFLELINYKATDFLFFISSSILYRFYKLETINKYFNVREEMSPKYSDIHRSVANMFNSFIPMGKMFYMGSFSIKKGANIYGIIFGSNHTLGIDKFLKIAWNHDKINGEANFDIDNDNIDLAQPNMFDELNKSSKLNTFQNELENLILEEVLKTDQEIYIHTLKNGFLPIHSREIINKLIKAKKIEKKSYKISSDAGKRKYIPQEIIILK